MREVHFAVSLGQCRCHVERSENSPHPEKKGWASSQCLETIRRPPIDVCIKTLHKWKPHAAWWPCIRHYSAVSPLKSKLLKSMLFKCWFQEQNLYSLLSINRIGRLDFCIRMHVSYAGLLCNGVRNLTDFKIVSVVSLKTESHWLNSVLAEQKFSSSALRTVCNLKYDWS